MKTIEIKKGWYWSAGNKFKWKATGYDGPGVGIDCRILAVNDHVQVFVDDVAYILDCEEARAFARRFDAFETHLGVRLAVISKSLFKAVPVDSFRSGE